MNKEKFSKRAWDLVSKLTVEEKCSILSFESPEIPRLNIPKYNWWNEGLHGVARAGTATVFPQAIGLAATFSPALVRKAAEITALEARAKYNVAKNHDDRDIYKGLTLWAPNVNIFRDPRWGRGQETYGEDPFLTGELACAYLRGLHGNGDYILAAGCLKHFAVHSGPEAIRHGFSADVSEKDLEETYLPAFKKAVKLADGVMGAFNAVNGEPACASDFLTHKLREEWGFDGYFVSDCGALEDLTRAFHIADTPEDAAVMAFNHECDLNCGSVYKYIINAFNNNKINEAQINISAARLLTLRIQLGMFDETNYDVLGTNDVCTDEARKLNREIATKSMVLLKNNGILPLKNDAAKTIAVIGPTADSVKALEGNYNGTSDRYITFLRGLQDNFDGKIIYAKGSEITESKTEPLAEDGDRLAEAAAAAECADVVILCIGLDAGVEGEQGDASNSYSAGDRINLGFPEPQKKLIEKVFATGKPVITVITSGGGMNLECDDDAARIQAWYSGAEGGNALCDILFGKVSPSGKLPVTFYKSADLLPEFTDYSMENRTYKNILNKNNILYPFGFGLTYGNIKIKAMKWVKKKFGGMIIAIVQNTGRETEDVLQVYVKTNSPDAPRNHSLCGMLRISLKQNQKKKIIIPVDIDAFTVVRDDGKRYIDAKSDFIIYLDTKQPDENSKFIKLKLDDIGKGE